jgi:hypothetical protein
VLPLKILYSYPGFPIADQGRRGRREVLGTSFSEYERQIRQQFTDMFARTERGSADDSLRAYCFREYGPGRHHGSSQLDS